MDDLERLRQERLRELQAQQAQASESDAQDAAAEQAAAQEAAIERLLGQILDEDARSRLTRIRLSRPEFADQVTKQLVSLAQTGRIQRRLGDTELRAILAQLTPQQRDINITRK
ncbi:MAG: DNA-binding protein [Thermoplasmatota archaeon]